MKFGYQEPAPRFVPHAIQPPEIEGLTWTNLVPNSVHDGRFYQPLSSQETERRRIQMNDAVSADEDPVKSFALMPLSVYQDWVELDWKEPHATPQANNRLAKKLREEGVFEIGAELERHDADDVDAKLKLVDELGDGLWTSVAALSNAGRHLNRASAKFLHREELAAKVINVVRFVDIDYALASGFVPSAIRHAIAPDMVDHDDLDSEIDIVTDNFYTPGFLYFSVLRQYEDLEDRRKFVSEGHFVKQAEILETQFMEYFMLLGYTAHKRAGTSLAQVAAHNYDKVTGRVATNTVDKTDGKRA